MDSATEALISQGLTIDGSDLTNRTISALRIGRTKSACVDGSGRLP